MGPIVVAGDFNAHLGQLGGPRDMGESNQQGVLLDLVLRRCDLYVASLADFASDRSTPIVAVPGTLLLITFVWMWELLQNV